MSIHLREYTHRSIQLKMVDRHAYTYLTYHSFCRAIAQKYGYEDVEEFKQKAQKEFSLVETGIVNQPSTRLLLINVRLPFSSPKYERRLTRDRLS